MRKGVIIMFKSITANLMVESVEETLGFYKEVLDFTEVAAMPGESGRLLFAIAARDGCQLMFQERNSLCGEYPILATDVTKPSISIFIMVGGDFDGFYEIVKSRRELLTEIHTTFYGTKEFAVADNNGYVLTFAEQK